MEKTFGQELIESLCEALAHAKSDKTGVQKRVIYVPDPCSKVEQPQDDT